MFHQKEVIIQIRERHGTQRTGNLRYNKENHRLGMVSHACNPTYSGGRVQDDHGLRPD
jgi:hypothetical protein